MGFHLCFRSGCIKQRKNGKRYNSTFHINVDLKPILIAAQMFVRLFLNKRNKK